MFDAWYFYLVLILRILLVSYFKEEFPDQVKLKPLTEKNYLCLLWFIQKLFKERERGRDRRKNNVFIFSILIHLTFTCSELTIEKLEKGVKCVYVFKGFSMCKT